MKRTCFFFIFAIALFAQNGFAQTRINVDQIEDAFVRKSGGALFGDLVSATSTIEASTIAFPGDEHVFYIRRDGGHALLRSNLDLYLDPTNNGTAGAVIVPVTLMEFPDFIGDKIRFYSTAYKIGVSAYDLDLTSDRNIKFHSDTAEDLMVIAGDAGDVTVKNNLTLGGLLQLHVFTSMPTGVAGQVIYFDHASDNNQDGLYVYTSTGWRQL
ncbi:hypothetical protein K8I31_19470 [bacterium]|nr:hypothetical protein [bacterium]